MDWKRIELLREQFAEIKGEPNEHIVRELLTYIEAMKPRMEILFPKKENLQQTYLDFSRIPKDIKQGSSQEVRIGKMYTDLENAVIRATHTSKLTDTQRDKLDKDVTVINATLDDSTTTTIASPNDLYLQNILYQKFADNKIKAMASHMASNGKIIDTLAAYEHPQGWLTYERNNRATQNTPSNESPQGLAGVVRSPEGSPSAKTGFMPGTKRIDDDN